MWGGGEGGLPTIHCYVIGLGFSLGLKVKKDKKINSGTPLFHKS